MDNYKIETTLLQLARQQLALESAIVLVEQLREEFHVRLELLRVEVANARTMDEQKALKALVDALFTDYSAALSMVESFGKQILKGN